MKKVSVVIPVYNMENSITMCVNSILKQTYRNIEIILIDDGSTDTSLVNCKTLEDKNSNVKVWHTKNQGSGPARNLGVDMATGDYVYFPDADDVIKINTLEILVETINKTNADLVVFGYQSINDKRHIIEEKKYKTKLLSGEEIRLNYENFANMSSDYGIQGAPWNKFFNLDIIKKNKIKYPPLRRHQDEVFIARYVAHTQNVCFISDVLYTYYTNDLKRQWDKYPVDYIEIIEKLKEYKIETIISWNIQNTLMQNNLNTEYICNYIKALELTFSNKFGFSKIERYKWIKNKVSQSELLKISSVTNLSSLTYQNEIMKYIKGRNYIKLYVILKLKVFVNLHMNWLLLLLKRCL